MSSGKCLYSSCESVYKGAIYESYANHVCKTYVPIFTWSVSTKLVDMERRPVSLESFGAEMTALVDLTNNGF